jgi:hypothetical protein
MGEGRFKLLAFEAVKALASGCVSAVMTGMISDWSSRVRKDQSGKDLPLCSKIFCSLARN